MGLQASQKDCISPLRFCPETLCLTLWCYNCPGQNTNQKKKCYPSFNSIIANNASITKKDIHFPYKRHTFFLDHKNFENTEI